MLLGGLLEIKENVMLLKRGENAGTDFQKSEFKTTTCQ
jgi:hypothetical protein